MLLYNLICAIVICAIFFYIFNASFNFLIIIAVIIFLALIIIENIFIDKISQYFNNKQKEIINTDIAENQRAQQNLEFFFTEIVELNIKHKQLLEKSADYEKEINYLKSENEALNKKINDLIIDSKTKIETISNQANKLIDILTASIENYNKIRKNLQPLNFIINDSKKNVLTLSNNIDTIIITVDKNKNFVDNLNIESIALKENAEHLLQIYDKLKKRNLNLINNFMQISGLIRNANTELYKLKLEKSEILSTIFSEIQTIADQTVFENTKNEIEIDQLKEHLSDISTKIESSNKRINIYVVYFNELSTNLQNFKTAINNFATQIFKLYDFYENRFAYHIN